MAVAPTLPDIQKELHASETATAWLLTGACLLAALASLIVPKRPSRSRTAAMAMASD